MLFCAAGQQIFSSAASPGLNSQLVPMQQAGLSNASYPLPAADSTYPPPVPMQPPQTTYQPLQSLVALKNPPAAQLPFTTTSDSFAIPARWNVRIIHPQSTASTPSAATGNPDPANLLARLPIRQVTFGKEILVDATPVRLYGTFLIQDGKTAVKFKVEQINSADVTFSTGRDFTLYRYLVPSELMKQK